MEKSENGINCRCRFLVVCGALACTCYVAAGNYRQWQERPLVTSLKVYLQSVQSRVMIPVIWLPGHQQASAGLPLPQRDHLHRGDRPGRCPGGGDGAVQRLAAGDPEHYHWG